MKKQRLIVFSFFMLIFSYATSKAGLEVKITPVKSTYLLHEPILIDYQVKNLGPDSVQFNKDEIINGFRVVDSKNSTDFVYGRYEISYLRLPPGRHPTIKSGEVVEGTTGLRSGKKLSNTSHTKTLPIEKYRVYLEVPYGEDKTSKSNTIDFEIVEPRGEEKLAYDELLVADSLYGLKNFEATCQKWADISRKYPASVYAPPAFSNALSLLRTTDTDKVKLMDLSHEFIEKYPNSHYIYSATLNILEYYQSKKDKAGFIEELNSLIKKYPESEVSKWAKNRLETIDMLKF